MKKKKSPPLKALFREAPLKCSRKKKFIRKGTFTVYVLECVDGSFYTGHTHDIQARLQLHEKGLGAKYVRSHAPFKLIYTKAYRYFRRAFLEELRIKSLTRKEKELLIFGSRKRRNFLRERRAC